MSSYGHDGAVRDLAELRPCDYYTLGRGNPLDHIEAYIAALEAEHAAHMALLEASGEAYSTWEPLLADADLDAGSNPAWLTLEGLAVAIEASRKWRGDGHER